MKRIFIPTAKGADWQRLLAKPSHWKPGYSAMTAAAAWEAAENRLPAEISTLLRLSKDEALTDLQLLAAFPEWEVTLEGGTTTSNTDVMAICRNAMGLAVVAVEAKVDEDFGPTVGEKRSSPSDGQLRRFAQLESILGVSKFNDSIRYQLLHRTASAILTAREFHAGMAAMVVQSWGSKESVQGDFLAFCAAMGAKEIALGLFRANPAEGLSLLLGWCAGDQRFRNADLRPAD